MSERELGQLRDEFAVMTFLLDVNVLIVLIDLAHIPHDGGAPRPPARPSTAPHSALARATHATNDDPASSPSANNASSSIQVAAEAFAAIAARASRHWPFAPLVRMHVLCILRHVHRVRSRQSQDEICASTASALLMPSKRFVMRWHAQVLVVIHTQRGERTRLISARKASRGEADRYHA